MPTDAGSAAGGRPASGPAGGGTPPAGDKAAPLDGDERAELDRLRAEVATLRAGAATPDTAPRARHRLSWRTPVAVLLIVLGCICAPLSVFAVWSANQISNTDRYVANVTPLIHDPAIQRALTDKISNGLSAQLDVQGLTRSAASALTARGLTRAGSLLDSLSGPIAGAVDGFIHTQVARIVASPQVARLWTQANRTAHVQVVKVLSGQGPSAVTVSNGQVVVDLAPFIDIVKKDLSARGLTFVGKLPSAHPTLTLFSADKLVKAQTAYRFVNDLKIVLPIVTVVLLGLGVYVARNHRRALIGAGLGFSASMLVLGAGLAIFRGIYLSSVPNDVLPGDAAAALYDTLVRFIQDGLRLLLVIGLIVAIGAFFTGPSVTAVRTRQAISSALGWVRSGGQRAGLRSGPAGRWTYAHRRALRITAVVAAVLIFIFWSNPTGLVAVIIAICLLVALGLVELIGSPPAAPPAASQHGTS